MKITKALNGILIATTLLSSCNSVEKKKEAPKDTLEQSFNKLDTSMQKLKASTNTLGRTISFLDSNLKYGRMAKEMEIKMVKAEADYYRTQDEKYYNRYYKFQKEQWRLVGLANKYYDSLQSQKSK